MKNTTVAGLLRAALALWTAAVLTAAAYFVPVFMRHICAVRPNWQVGTAGCSLWMAAGGHDAVGVYAVVAGDGDRRTRAGICAQKCHALQAGVATVGGLVLRYARDWYFHGPDQYPSALSGADGRRPFAGHGHGGAGSFALSGLCQSAACCVRKAK